MTQVTEPFPIFYDDDGTPLENGMIYVGEANQDPRTNPVAVFYDEALTVPAAQPIRTLGGRPAYQGAPANLYISEAAYSITVQNRRGSPIVDADDVQSDFVTRNALAASTGAALIGKAGGGTVQDFIDAADGRGLIYMEDYGADGTQAGDSAALKAAITAAAATWSPVILPARRIFWDGSIISEDKVRLWGAGMPALNSGKTALEGGTIIQGGLLFAGDYIDLRDFGVDIGSASGVTATDAIKCLASPLNSGKSLHTENIIGLCNSPASAVHALLFEGYAEHTGGNIHGVSGFFSVVIKNRNVRLTNVKGTDSSDTGLYLKSDNTFGQCSNVQIDSVEVTGATAGAVDYAVRFQADSALMDNIQVGQIRAKGHGTSLLVQTLNFTGASFGSARVGSIISEGAATDDVWIYNLKPAGNLNHVSIGSIISINPAAKAVNLLCESSAEIDAVHIGSLYASYASGTTSGVLDGAVFVGSGVLRSDIRSATLLVEHSDATLGALNYAATGGDHVLGARVARVTGPGRPTPGYSVQALSGTTATLVVPRNEAGTRTSLVKLTHAAPITITTFALPTSSDTPFEFGHILTLFNATGNVVTVNNNGAGGVLNPGYANVTFGENEVKSWVVGDDNVWRGLP